MGPRALSRPLRETSRGTSPDMIKSVHFTGFRSLKDVELRLGPLTALVGPNATGVGRVASLRTPLTSPARG
jgi:ABC-type branched-subunit amino acid transport system ATPase component